MWKSTSVCCFFSCQVNNSTLNYISRFVKCVIYPQLTLSPNTDTHTHTHTHTHTLASGGSLLNFRTHDIPFTILSHDTIKTEQIGDQLFALVLIYKLRFQIYSYISITLTSIHILSLRYVFPRLKLSKSPHTQPHQQTPQAGSSSSFQSFDSKNTW